MSVKVYDVPGIGPVSFQKRRGTRHLRITITGSGEVRVGLPPWAPYRLGLEFAKNKQAWITKHRKQPQILKNGQTIGKAHRLVFLNGSAGPTSRLVGNEVRVSYAANLDISDTKVQLAAQRGAKKALQLEAESLLPSRLQQLAKKHGFSYHSLRIKHLKTKWGSCTHKSEITLNSFLMTLPWDLIDYVLLHELLHTKILRHGEPFWGEFKKILPDVQTRRKAMKNYRPHFG